MNSGHIEEISCRRLEQAFRAAFDDVVIMPNLVISLTNGHRLPTAEIDCTVVCNSGVFLFEIKGWSDAHVSREVVVGQEAKCSRRLNIDPPGVRRKTWTGLCRKSKARSVFERTE